MSVHEYRLITNSWFYLLVVGSLIAMATYTWQFRKAPGVKEQVYIEIFKGIWLSGLVMITVSTGASYKLFWAQVVQVASTIAPYFWFRFVIRISRQQDKVPQTLQYSLIALTGCIVAAIVSNSWHGLFWQQAILQGERFQVLLGPGVWLSRLNSYVLCMLAFGFSIRWVVITGGLRRRQALWFTIAGGFSAIGSIVALLPKGAPFSPLPVSFLISALLITWGFYRWHTYTVLALGQEVVVRDMIDGLVVVDEYGYIADMNPAMKGLLGDVPVKIGGKFERLTSLWPELATVCTGNAVKTLELFRHEPQGLRYYRLTMTPLQSRKRWLGRVLVLKDVTEQREQQKKLLEQEKTLSILNERDRIGRELHDDKAQVSNFLGLELQNLRHLLTTSQDEAALAKVDRLRDIIKGLNTDIRESIVGLKKTNTARCQFMTQLREYVSWYEQHRGIAVELILPEESLDSLFSDLVKLQLLRIIQEALTNIRKHARAHKAKVAIEKAGSQIVVTIADDGCGFDQAALQRKDKSFGLQIMAERAQEVGGELTVATKPGEGTKVIVCF
ncbi:MAG: histidine kinase N-terminal 7TM domain-containing protein [Sporomusaceae bacterium]|nr:histidine kinase N-terminal 7TM domain-containing protein [Sporomusaceae bacterium]